MAEEIKTIITDNDPLKHNTFYFRNCPRIIFDMETIFKSEEFKIIKHLEYRRPRNKDCICMLVQLPPGITLADLRKKATEFAIENKCKDIYIEQAEMSIDMNVAIHRAKRVEIDKKNAPILEKIRSKMSNHGRCCICHDNHEKYVNFTHGFKTCCPNHNKVCLKKLKNICKAAGIVVGSWHNNCDKAP